jgi:hypothetical protein
MTKKIFGKFIVNPEIVLSLSSMRKEQIILEYLDFKYGNRETYENEKSIGIDGVCIYYKNIKQVGVPGKNHLDLVKWFGEGRYQSLVGKWFCDKYNLVLVK